MRWIEIVVFLAGGVPLAWAWRANRRGTLVHALNWAVAAWLAWAGLAVAPEGQGTARYLALCLTGCAGVAVLGARRPVVGPWNFVLLGLLAVLLLPLAENAVLGTPLLDPLRLVFVVATLAVGVLNYLPTRLAPSVLLVAAACGAELLVLDGAVKLEWTHLGRWALPLAIWVGWLRMRRRGEGLTELDREWLGFRDRYGLMWGQRVREQFNQAARHAGWPVYLRWSGLRRTARDVPLSPEDQEAIVQTLRVVLKRFGEE